MNPDFLLSLDLVHEILEETKIVRAMELKLKGAKKHQQCSVFLSPLEVITVVHDMRLVQKFGATVSFVALSKILL